ncbi:uncharacterized protein LOC117619531 [Prunus dulcis]|uniref:uncharacterized protein LOC117619531 n=1 Tax=Prunus dulcis TaxID=3755 RepID=UPI001483A437|nr:uncharacterized protein LOC117619531 [Prunus dulcis]
MEEQCSLLDMRWRPSIFVWEVSCKSSRAFNLGVTDLGSGDFFFSTPFDSGFHLSCLRIFASFVFSLNTPKSKGLKICILLPFSSLDTPKSKGLSIWILLSYSRYKNSSNSLFSNINQY